MKVTCSLVHEVIKANLNGLILSFEAVKNLNEVLDLVFFLEVIRSCR